MKCPRCQVENDAGARFCEDCGGRLEAAYPSYGPPKHLAEKILTSGTALEASGSR
jgi:hypothetical protein